MKAKTSIKKNFMYQMIYEVLVLILPFITSPYIARVIGAEGLGIYSYSNSVASYFVLFSMLGIKNYGNRAIAKSRDNESLLSETFSNILALHILISIIFCLVYVGYVMNTVDDDQVYACIQGLYVLSGLFDISWFYFGIEHFKLTVSRNILIKILNVTCVFVFVRSVDDLWVYCLIMALGQLISQLSMWIPLKKYVRFTRPNWSKMKPHIKPLFILFIPAVAISLYKYMDKIMVGAISTKAQLGCYENAEKVINIPMTIIASFGTVMMPKMSNLAAGQNKKEGQKYIIISMEFVMCLAFALAFGMAGVGTIFAPVFWGDKFELSGILIMGLAITIPFISFANVIRTQYLIPNALDKEYLASVVAGAIVNVIINALLIKEYGAMGAVIGTIAAEVVVCVWQCCVVRNQLPMEVLLKKSLPFLPTGVLMFTIVYAIGNLMGISIKTLFLQIFIGGVVYLVFCIFYFIKTQNDVVMKAISNCIRHLDQIRKGVRNH